eukprot:jgi/Hompol1/5275/HPOL_004331-RA
MLLVSSILLVAIIGFKFLAAIHIGGKGNPEVRSDKYVLCCIPCYSEGADSLKSTIDSVAETSFDDGQKLLFIICDGMVTGSGNSLPTPQIVVQLMQGKLDAGSLVYGSSGMADTADSFAFQSLGHADLQLNRGQVYSGLYTIQGRQIPYIVVIKVGNPTEQQNPGNRGKRDSQLLLMQFLSRVHRDADMSPLEHEIYRHFCDVIGVNPKAYELLLWVDADTEIARDSINHFVSAMAGDSAISGICGETRLRNEQESWITMIQIYEYYISHHLAKAFESVFGSVTCLPGCFCMYRIFSSATNAPVLVSPAVIADYGINSVETLHMKNLLQLGEDRYLTTLILKHFPQTKIKFTEDARALTNAPRTWSVLISQRRRWINSTVHNLLELMTLRNMCGCCVFSMRFVVFLDLFATVTAPAGFIYVVYLFVNLAIDEDAQIPFITLIMLAAIYGLQVLIFTMKQEWQHIGWMFVYLLATPIYAFVLPLYSFWNMDDFSWGETRMLARHDEEELGFDDKDIDQAFVVSVSPLKHGSEAPASLNGDASAENDPDDEPIVSVDKSGTKSGTKSGSGSGSGSRRTGVYGMPSDFVLRNRIRQIISATDTRRMSRRTLRSQLEAEYGGIDLSTKADLIAQHQQQRAMSSYWRKAGFTYLKYSNITAQALRSVLKGDAKTLAARREEIGLKQSLWKDGKQGENKIVSTLPNA